MTDTDYALPNRPPVRGSYPRTLQNRASGASISSSLEGLDEHHQHTGGDTEAFLPV